MEKQSISGGRIWLASAVAAFLAVLPYTVMTAYAVITWESAIIDGEIDNDPVRAVGLMLLLTPLIWFVLATLSALLGFTLRYFGRLSTPNIFWAMVVPSVGLAGFLSAWDDLSRPAPLLFGLTIFAFCVFSGCCGLLGWWLVAFRRHARATT